MSYPVILAGIAASRQSPSSPVFDPSHPQTPCNGSGVVDLPPDAIRLLGAILPSGLTIGSHAAAYVGDGWVNGTIVATGITSATVATTRYGSHIVKDRRNLLTAQEAAKRRRDLTKWRRDRAQEQEAGA